MPQKIRFPWSLARLRDPLLGMEVDPVAHRFQVLVQSNVRTSPTSNPSVALQLRCGIAFFPVLSMDCFRAVLHPFQIVLAELYPLRYLELLLLCLQMEANRLPM